MSDHWHQYRRTEVDGVLTTLTIGPTDKGAVMLPEFTYVTSFDYDPHEFDDEDDETTMCSDPLDEVFRDVYVRPTEKQSASQQVEPGPPNPCGARIPMIRSDGTETVATCDLAARHLGDHEVIPPIHKVRVTDRRIDCAPSCQGPRPHLAEFRAIDERPTPRQTVSRQASE